MKITHLLVIAVALFVSTAFADPTPQWPKSFSTSFDLFRKTQSHFFLGRWFRDEDAKMERFDTSGDYGWDVDLRDYSQGKRYNIFHTGKDELVCTVANISTELSSVDVSSFKYAGKVTINNQVLDHFNPPADSHQFASYFQNPVTSEPARIEGAAPNTETLDFLDFRKDVDAAIFDLKKIAPNVRCNERVHGLSLVRMAWLDAPYKNQLVSYYRPPAMNQMNVTAAPTCETGQASWYQCTGNAACAACNTGQYIAAHKTIGCGTGVTVTDTSNGKSVNVKIEDRGPFVAGRIVDLNQAPAQAIGMIDAGVVPCRVC